MREKVFKLTLGAAPLARSFSNCSIAPKTGPAARYALVCLVLLSTSSTADPSLPCGTDSRHQRGAPPSPPFPHRVLHQCPPTLHAQIVTGRLPSLPGCNPLTKKTPTKMATCPSLKIPAFFSKPRAYKGLVAPPGACNSCSGSHIVNLLTSGLNLAGSQVTSKCARR